MKSSESVCKRFPRKKRVLYSIFFLLISALPVQRVQAKEQTFEIDYAEIEAVLDEIGINEGSSFEELVFCLLRGDYSITEFKEQLFAEGIVLWRKEKTQLLRLFTIAIAAAIFTNFTKSLKQGQAAEIGFLVSYMLIAVGMLSVFPLNDYVRGNQFGKIVHS